MNGLEVIRYKLRLYKLYIFLIKERLNEIRHFDCPRVKKQFFPPPPHSEAVARSTKERMFQQEETFK